MSYDATLLGRVLLLLKLVIQGGFSRCIVVGRRIVAALTLVAYLVDARVGGVRSMCVLRTGFWFCFLVA